MHDVPPLAPSAPLGELVPCLLPTGLDLALERVVLEPDGLTLALVSTQARPCCPLCQTAATRVQSRYTRTLLDLPWATCRVRLALTVRRFICPTDSCVRKIFTERLPQLVAPYARRTSRLQELLLTTGFALGGEAGARQCATWHVAVSGATLLQLLRQHPPAPGPTPRVLGVDEFARRKGRTYSTILVDLERHAVVDLLPESSNEVFATWLRAHPGIEVISRDRGEAYGTGATAGAPDAVQVADRWHILKNLGDALQKVLGRHVADLRRAAQESGCAAAAPPPLPAVPSVRPPRCRPRTPKSIMPSAQRVRQLALYQRVHDLVTQGWSVAAIARELTIQKATVRKYRDMAQFRDQRTTARPSVVEPYRGYVEQRWAEGCTEVKQLWEELQSRGFRGCYKSAGSLPAVGSHRNSPKRSRRHAFIRPRSSARRGRRPGCWCAHLRPWIRTRSHIVRWCAADVPR